MDNLLGTMASKRTLEDLLRIASQLIGVRTEEYLNGPKFLRRKLESSFKLYAVGEGQSYAGPLATEALCQLRCWMEIAGLENGLPLSKLSEVSPIGYQLSLNLISELIALRDAVE